MVKSSYLPEILVVDHQPKCEILFVKLHNISVGPFVIGVCYRPANNNYIQTFGISEQEVADNICSTFPILSDCDSILCGDFNLPSLTWPSPQPCSGIDKTFMDNFHEALLEQIVSFPTRVNNILELVVVNCPERVSVHPAPGFSSSDHDVSVKISIERRHRHIKPEAGTAVYSRMNIWAMRAYFESIDWARVFCCLTASESWRLFMDHYKFAISSFVPVQKFNRKKPFPWMSNPTVRDAERHKKLIWRSYKRSHLHSVHSLYRLACSDLRRTIAAARIQYERDLAANIGKNVKKFFNYSKRTVKPAGRIETIRDPNGRVVHDPVGVASAINNHFASVFVDEPDGALPVPGTGWCPHEIRDAIFSVADIRKLLLNLKSFKSPGPDSIKPLVLKRCAYQLAVPLFYIFRKSIDSGDVPSDWKLANVTPIKKVPRSMSLDDLRPISLTCVCAKIMERLIWNSVLPFLTNNDLICDNQHGALPGRSVVSNLLVFLNAATSSFDAESLPGHDVVYIDFKKAFDTVPLRRLSQKLEFSGIRGNLLRWFNAFLHNRKQRVVLNGKATNWVDVRSGIPQGTLSGPYCYLIYVNDLSYKVRRLCGLEMFVDDVRMSKRITNLTDCFCLQSAIQQLELWCDDWLMSPKRSKCNVLRIRPKIPFQYELREGAICEVFSVKDLGIVVSNSLKFNDHFDFIESSANRRIGLLRRAVLARSADVIVPLYKALVRPILEYGAVLWSPQYNVHIARLEAIQRRCLHLARDIDVNQVSTLEQRRATIDLINTYKILDNLSPLSADDFFTRTRCPHLRGHVRKLAVNYCRTNVRQHFLSNRIIEKWNDLPSNVATSESLNVFKVNLRGIR